MPVVDIRKVRVAMHQWIVHMRMGVRFLAVPREIMRVLVMFVVAMAMIMRQRLMRMLVSMTLADMKPNTHSHQHPGHPERKAWVLSEQKQRQRGPDEGGSREIGTRTRRAAPCWHRWSTSFSEPWPGGGPPRPSMQK